MAKRRSNGEGAIYQTKDGRWRAAVDLGWKDSKRDRKYLSGTTKAAVAKKVREALAQADAGVPLTRDGRGPTVEEWLWYWLANVQARRVRPSTRETQRAHIRVHLAPALGKIRIRDLTPERVEAFEMKLVESGLSGASALKVHRTLSRALKVAMQRGLVSRNVCTLIDSPAVVRHEVEPLTTDEAKRILKTAAQGRSPARWSVALSLGLRQGEALGLAWDNIDLEVGTLSVRQALARSRYAHGCDRQTACGKRPVACPHRVGEGMHLEKPKSRAGDRVITLPLPLVEALRAHRVEQHRERLLAGQAWWTPPPAPRGYSWDLVFRTADGRPMQPARDYRDWRALLESAGVRHARLHDARHTAATMLLGMDVKPRVVMEILGHSKISLTYDTYSHVMQELQRAAADQMGAALWGEESLRPTAGDRDDE
jgi:integrase